MNYFTIKLTKLQIEKLLGLCQKGLVKESNKYILFHYKKDKVEIIAYTTGSIVIKGDNIEEEIKKIKSELKIYDYEAIGSDEVGTGDLFGPVCVCATLVRKKDFELLEKLNIRDSKKMTDEKILKSAPILMKNLLYTLIILSPIEYNSLVNKGCNLNKIKALLHNRAYIKLITKYPKPVQVIQDKFCSEENYFSYLKDEKFVHREILFIEKAETYHKSVAASAVISRYAFLKTLEKMEISLNKKLPKGCANIAVETLAEIIKARGEKIIKSIVKTNFKSVKDAILVAKK